MLVKDAIQLICDKQGVFIVKRYIRNHKKHTENDLKGICKSKFFCKNHNKCHKYTFHSRISFCPGTERFIGLDTAKEVIEYAKNLIRFTNTF